MKKLISLLLCVMMAFSSFSVVMAADEAEAEPVVTNADLAAMQAIGVFDTSLVTGAPLTRRQLADIYFEILLPDQSDDEYIPTKVYFDDILESDFAINMVHEMGIMNGMGDNKFMPDNSVTYIQVVKTLVDFLGYRQYAEAYGGYPNGYAVMAANFDFDRYAPANMNMICTTDMAAVLFRQALDVKVNQYIFEKENGDSYYEINDMNYLELYTHVYINEGIITATYIEDIYQYSDTGYFDIRIDNIPVTLSDAVLEMNELLGHKVTYFYNLDKQNNKIVLHYEVVDTDVIELNSDNIDNYNTSTDYIHYFNENGKAKKIKITDAYIFYNGTLTASYNKDDINPFAAGDIDGFIRVVSTDGDMDEAEYVFIEAFNSYLVSTVQGDHILNKYHPEVVFDAEAIRNGEVVMKNVLGEVISPDAVEEYDILNAFANKSGKVTKIIISLDTYVGTVDAIRRNGDKIETLTIDGQEFRTSANLALTPELASIKVGVKLKAIFNHLGKICDVTVGDYDKTMYGYIMDAKVIGTMTEVVSIKMLTTKNTIDGIEVAENVAINGVKSNAETLLAMLGDPVNAQICRYKMNSAETAIVEISFAEVEGGFYRYPNLTTVEPYYRNNSMHGERLLKSSAPVFMIPYYDADKADDELYRAADASIFGDSNKASMAAAGGHLTELADGSGLLQFNDVFEMYGTNLDNPTAEACVYYIKDEDSFGITDGLTASGLLLVTDIVSVYENDEHMYQITGYVNGALKTYLAEPKVLEELTDGITLEVGDVCQMTTGYSGELLKLTLIFDTSEWEYSSAYTTNPAPQRSGQSTGFTHERFFYGTVEYLDDFAMTVEIPPISSGDPMYQSHVYSGTKFYEYTVDARGNKTITFETGGVLRGEYPHGMSSKIFMYCDGAVPSFAIVVNP